MLLGLDYAEEVGIMRHCEFKATCFFINEIIDSLPFTTQYEKARYCDGDFTNCTIRKVALDHGINKVPRYLSPGDKYELY